MARLPVAVLISGRGSNMAALVAAAAEPAFPAEIVAVIANRPDAAGLATAAGAGIPTAVVDHKRFAGKPAFEAALSDEIARHGAALICLAGFMRIVSADFVARWRGQVLNIHPSLLPSFPGLDTHARALAAGVRLHGCTVHFVDAEVDAGPIVAQAAVPVLPGDDAETLAARVLAAEHRLYPRALALVASGKVRREGDRAVISSDAGAAATAMLMAPS
ncbi:MAG TPA: phosphoribosylglycinamide formyltransferase [Hyphomicrobiales bacterium]|nr:phosphoribosylglycinamide formyltransferase [Hyphomicrobiales bacterium]